MADSEEKKKKSPITGILLLVGVVILILAIGASLYFYHKYQKAQAALQNPTFVAEQQAQDLLTRVGKLIELPKDETPTIATVSDVTKLQGQPFFANAKNGDKVLIYTKNKKAILYDPTLNIIVEVAPVNIGQPTPSISPVPTKKAVVARPTATPTPQQ